MRADVNRKGKLISVTVFMLPLWREERVELFFVVNWFRLTALDTFDGYPETEETE